MDAFARGLRCNRSELYLPKHVIGSADRTLKVEPHRVTVGCQSTFGFVEMSEFLTALAKRVQSNTNSADMYKKQHQPASEPEELGFGGKLKADVFYHHIQVRLTSHSRSEREHICVTSCAKIECPAIEMYNRCNGWPSMPHNHIGARISVAAWLSVVQL